MCVSTAVFYAYRYIIQQGRFTTKYYYVRLYAYWYYGIIYYTAVVPRQVERVLLCRDQSTPEVEHTGSRSAEGAAVDTEAAKLSESQG